MERQKKPVYRVQIFKTKKTGILNLKHGKAYVKLELAL